MKNSNFNELLAISKNMSDQGPELDSISQGAIDHYEICKSLSYAYPTEFQSYNKCLDELKIQLQQKIESLSKNSECVAGEFDIPRVGAEYFSSSYIVDFIKNPCPVVFENAADHTEAIKLWNPDYFMENYGDFPCSLYTSAEGDTPGVLSDALVDIMSGVAQGRYAHNIANIFNEHPSLEAQLDLKYFCNRLGHGKHFGTQLFVGGNNTGTLYHCANNLNIFFNIYGQKEWYFVHPKFTFWMEGLLQKNGAFADSPIDHNKSVLEQTKKFPLYQYVPVYKAILNPGDILINPNWWWHAINNVTQATISCAVRWIPYQSIDANPAFSLASRLVPEAKNIAKLFMSSHGRLTDELYRNNFERINKRRKVQPGNADD